jgi:hypothetical protein
MNFYWVKIVLKKLINCWCFKLGTGKGGKSIWGKKFADEIVPTLKVNKNVQIATCRLFLHK